MSTRTRVVVSTPRDFTCLSRLFLSGFLYLRRYHQFTNESRANVSLFVTYYEFVTCYFNLRRLYVRPRPVLSFTTKLTRSRERFVSDFRRFAELLANLQRFLRAYVCFCHLISIRPELSTVTSRRFPERFLSDFLVLRVVSCKIKRVFCPVSFLWRFSSLSKISCTPCSSGVRLYAFSRSDKIC